MSDPMWLVDVGICQLLNFIVDRLDRTDVCGKTLTQALKLNADTFPALYRAEPEFEKEQQWGLR
ncbi:MAG: hypothetical protein V4568_11935 [Pseudomonadota bacterium]